jgi:hypothetical protein
VPCSLELSVYADHFKIAVASVLCAVPYTSIMHIQITDDACLSVQFG